MMESLFHGQEISNIFSNSNNRSCVPFCLAQLAFLLYHSLATYQRLLVPVIDDSLGQISSLPIADRLKERRGKIEFWKDNLETHL